MSQLVKTAWASASTFRGSDKRGGANGARLRLARRKTGRSTSLSNWQRCCRAEGVQADFNKAQSGGKKISLADLIVLAGCAGVEQAAKKAGHTVTVPFTLGAWTRRKSKPMWSPSPCSNRCGRVPELPQDPVLGVRRSC